MTKRREHFFERCSDVLQEIIIVYNHILRLETQYESIAENIKEEEKEEAYCNLEISLALLAILLRKMSENHWLKISEDDRGFINALIHSNRFEYQDGRILVYSKQSARVYQIEKFVTLAKTLLDAF